MYKTLSDFTCVQEKLYRNGTKQNAIRQMISELELESFPDQSPTNNQRNRQVLARTRDFEKESLFKFRVNFVSFSVKLQ